MRAPVPRALALLLLLLAAAAGLPTPTPAPPDPHTTVHIDPPEYPSPRYDYVERWHRTAPVPSPFADGLERPVEVRHAAGASPCGMLALIADPQVERTLWAAARRHQPLYNATVIWYKIESGCARPLYVMEYTRCDPQKHFGYCHFRTPPFWSSFLASFAYPTDDELGLVMAAPARLVAGQYRRAIYIDGVPSYTDFMVTLPPGECWFSRRSTESGLTFSGCFAAQDYEQGRVMRLTYLTQYYPQEAHKAMVDYWYMRHGGVVPPYFAESRRYDPPAPAGPQAPPGGDGQEEEEAEAATAETEEAGAGGDAGRRADEGRPEGWPALDALTRAPPAPGAEGDEGAAGAAGPSSSVALGVGLAVAAIACVAAAATGAYFVYARRRGLGGAGPPKKKAKKPLAAFGNVSYSALPG
uniref:Glycoprotein D n=1 Tax=Cervid alphaherpesvirus 2 TaxID=365327 RepID=Q2LDY3_9ALPH|nr:glycoprotein D [Cervid alphaherpesvirus 2]